ncbi:MAG: hypothetical protein LBJ64_12395 [Deltaproteobacteria bacterium]|nr:hypothetical protein [Deltaproteobacteria bacterium]
MIVRELDDDSAVVAMVDSNLQQREKILPSEKAWAYKLKMDALYHSSKKSDKRSHEIISEQTGESKNTVFRLLRLTEFAEKLLDKADSRELAFNTAVELSYLSFDEQHIVADCMTRHEIKPSLSQAIRLKKMKQAGTLTAEVIDKALSEEKKPETASPTSSAHYRKFFPP